MITSEQFKAVFPKCKEPDGWVQALSTILPKYDINTPKRITSFIAQCGHESAGWTTFAENLNYSAEGLKTYFGKYFINKDLNDYARKPEKIANLVYANRMGNGPEESGDGWKYRGRGPIQLTGKLNYSNFKGIYQYDVITNPDLVQLNKDVAILSGVWFWKVNELNKYIDYDNFKLQTYKINGGYNGLEDRIALYEKILPLIK